MRPQIVFTLGFSALLVTACNSRSDYYEGDVPDVYCRNNPADCPGEVGGACQVTEDCGDGVCCHEEKNCSTGMCLYRCGGDVDCPSGQLCEHGFCFFACSSDGDCGAGQKCEHGKTVCEYDDK